ncbi:hypothetical protein [Paenibacillus alkalitolerans]|uniref:hypothetical protein n=1 Tax=Paenibacillus alkalitolerans TaxID=2799335 RepID=UPI0018F72D31|nr:hypothetical protein [Paenibacillus alkalitolerans]
MPYTNFSQVAAESGFGIGAKGSETALFTKVFNGTTTIDPASIAAGAQATAAITVTGAALGDYTLVAPPYDLQGIQMSHSVTAADTVTIVLRNGTAAAIDLASGSWKAKVLR